MKFTRDAAVQDLTAKFADKAKGIDLARTISEVVDNNLAMVGENSEMELDAFVGFAEKNVATALGLARHENSNVANKLQEQIAALQAQISGKTPPPPPDPKANITSSDPAVQALLDEMKEIKASLAKNEKEQTIADKRKNLVAKMSESIKDKEWIESYLAEITITEETDVDAKAKDYVAFYNKTHTRGGKSTPIQTGGNDDTDNNVKDALEKAKALIKQRENVMGGSPVSTTNV